MGPQLLQILLSESTGLEFSEDKLEDDFQRLTTVLMESSEGNTFMYRDFQSRNVMIRDNTPWFIDFQGGRKRPLLLRRSIVFYGRQKPISQTSCVMSCSTYTYSRSTNISQSDVRNSSSACVISFSSAHSRYSEHMDSAVISKKNRTSCRACRLL